jgi:predicted amidohydrolase YtcJ
MIQILYNGNIYPEAINSARVSALAISADTILVCGSDEEIQAIGIKALQGKFPLSIHAIGDRANRVVINSLNNLKLYAIQHHLSIPRNRIEHLQLIAPSDLELLRGSGIVASMQPFHLISEQKMADRKWGARSEFSYAWKSIAETGTVLAFGSDAPVESPHPFAAIYAASTRLPPEFNNPEGWYSSQKIGVRDAFNGFTAGAAYAAGMGKKAGKLFEGYYADLIVLDKNPFSIPLTMLPALKTSATMVGGSWAWKGF